MTTKVNPFSEGTEKNSTPPLSSSNEKKVRFYVETSGSPSSERLLKRTSSDKSYQRPASPKNEIFSRTYEKLPNSSLSRTFKETVEPSPHFDPVTNRSLYQEHLQPTLQTLLQKDLNQIEKDLSMAQKVFQKLFLTTSVANKEEISMHVKNLIHAANKFLIDSNSSTYFDLSVVPKDGKAKSKTHFMNFPDTTMPSSFQDKILKILEEHVSISFEEISKNEKVLNNLNPLFKEILSDISTAKKEKNKIAELQKQLQLLDLYGEAIYDLCDMLIAKGERFVPPSDAKSKKGIYKIYELISHLIENENPPKLEYYAQIVYAIKSQYIEKILEEKKEELAVELIQILEKKPILSESLSKKMPVLTWDTFKKRLEERFESMDFNNLANEWERVLINNVYDVVDENEDSLLEKFEEEPNKEIKIVFKMNELLTLMGRHIFKDPDLFHQFFEIVDPILEKRFPQFPIPKHILQVHERNFNAFILLSKDSIAMQQFEQEVNKSLKERYEKSQTEKEPSLKGFAVPTTQEILGYLLAFYKFPYQEFAWGPVGVVRSVHKEVFSSNPPILDSIREGVNKTGNIQIKFTSASMEIKYFWRQSIGDQNLKSMCLQELTRFIPLPRVPPFRDPVILQFYYHRPAFLPPSEDKKLERTLRELAFTLKVGGFLPLKRIR